MQDLIFVRRAHGTSKKGNEYDMVEVSNGIASFTLSVAPGVGAYIEETYKEGEHFRAHVHVNVAFGALRGTIVQAE